MEAPVSKAEYETLSAFRYALRQFMHFSEEAAQAVGMTPQQYQALVVIKGFPQRDRVTVGELAERLFIRHHSAVELVNRLVGQGLAVREPDQEDRRQIFVTLTEQGEGLLNRLAASHREELRRIGPQLISLLDILVISQN